MSARTVLLVGALLGAGFIGAVFMAVLWWAAWTFLHQPRCQGTQDELGKTKAQLDLSREREMKAFNKADEAWRLVGEAREAERRAKNQLGYVTGLNSLPSLDTPFLTDIPINPPYPSGALPGLPAAGALSDDEFEQRWHAVVEMLGDDSNDQGGQP